MGVRNYFWGNHVYARSEDGRTDTITVFFGLIKRDVYHYNEKNQLLYRHDAHPFGESMQAYMREEFEYDKDGRLSKHVTKWISNFDTPSEKILSVSTYDYAKIRMTKEGYIFNSITHDFERDEIVVYESEYKLDDKGRVVQAIYDDKNDYIEYIDGKKYRIDAVYYSYSDNSYTMFGYYKTGNLVQGRQDMWWETTFVFDDYGNQKSKTVMVSTDGSDWTVWEKTETEYVFSADYENRTDNLMNGKVAPKVYGVDGAVMILSDLPAIIRVYSVSGLFIKEIKMKPGNLSIPLPKGLSIIMVGNEVYKAMVR